MAKESMNTFTIIVINEQTGEEVVRQEKCASYAYCYLPKIGA